MPRNTQGLIAINPPPPLPDANALVQHRFGCCSRPAARLPVSILLSVSIYHSDFFCKVVTRLVCVLPGTGFLAGVLTMTWR